MVSTIVPVYNRPHLVREAVQSVLAQTYRPIEVVIVDDGSTDDTAAVCDALAAATPDVIRVVHQANGGCAAAYNTGLAHITGEFVQFLDSDDLLMPEKFAVQVAALRAQPERGIAYCLTREYDMGRPWSGLPARRTGYVDDPLFPALLDGRLWPTVSPLYRRHVVEEAGPFLTLRVYRDWEFECRVASRGVRAVQCPRYLADMRCVHASEGRTKASASGVYLRDLAAGLTRIYDHARVAGVGGAAWRRYAARLLAAACRCAAAGRRDDTARLVERSRSCAGPWIVVWLWVFSGAARVVGQPAAGRAVDRILFGRPANRLRALRSAPRAFGARWRHRLDAAAAAIAGQPMVEWPGRLWSRWAQRESRLRARG